jgi:hypothetical protein
MFKSSRTFALVAFAAFAFAVIACSKGDGEIEVDASSSKLTDQGNDDAFTIKVTKTPDAGYPLNALQVKATPDGKDPVVMACTPNDLNNNNILDTGDTLTCKEGSNNDFGTSAAGTDITVDLYDNTDASNPTLIGEGTWTPAK